MADFTSVSLKVLDRAEGSGGGGSVKLFCVQFSGLPDLLKLLDNQLFFWDTMAREIIDKHVPVKTMRVRNHDAPYMNKQWKSAIRTKRKAEAKYRKNRTDENWEYKRKCRNEATRQRRLAIKQYWKTKADDLGKNPKDFFRTFKPFISDKGNRADADITINHGEAIVKDQSKVSEIFADYFATIADHIKSVDADLTDLKDFTNHPSVQAIKNKMEDTSETFEFQPVNRMQVKTALESLDTNKATGHDGIPAKILKAGAQELSLPLTTLFNSCIQGFPKCGIVGGDKIEVEGEIGASREGPGACSPRKILKIYNT